MPDDRPPRLPSLLGVWLRRLHLVAEPEPDDTAPPPPAPPSDGRLPLYLQAEHGELGLAGERLELRVSGAVTATAPMDEVSSVALVGNVAVTTPCLHRLMDAGIPVSWHAASGWFLGHTMGLGEGRLVLRRAQYRAAEDAARTLDIARPLVAAKIHGQRLLLRRNHKGVVPPRLALCRLERLEWEAERAEGLDQLRGLEGAAAAIYFKELGALLAPPEAKGWAPAFTGRHIRPPTDPVNAALSYAYALLARAAAVAAGASGLDVQQGFLHQPRAGRPALALDLMEPLRPLVADSIVLAAINRGQLDPGSFETTDAAVLLGPEGRKTLIQVFEGRLAQEVAAPGLERPITYRQWLSVQARLLGDLLTGARADFPQLRPR
jgi:CRISPR-associated protein Cas1